VVGTFKSTKNSVPVASLEANGDGIDDIVTTTKVNNKNVIDIFNGDNGSLLESFDVAG